MVGKTLPNRVVLEGAYNKSAVTHMIFNFTGDDMMGYFFNDPSCAPASMASVCFASVLAHVESN